MPRSWLSSVCENLPPIMDLFDSLAEKPKRPSIEIFHGDCVKGMRDHIPDASVDVVVTSPPYNLGIKYGSYHDTRAWDDYFAWTLEWTREVLRCLKPEGSFFLNIAGSPSSPMLPHAMIHLLVETHGLFHLQNTIHWIKSIALKEEDGIEKQRGHYKPINSPRFLNDCHEYVFHLTPKGRTPIDRLGIGVPYADKSNIARWGSTGGNDLKCRGNTWFIPYKTITRRAKDRPHPATFPTELAARCIRLHGNSASAVVMEPFLGIGHALMGAVGCGTERFVGFEIDSAYVDVVEAELRERGIPADVRR